MDQNTPEQVADAMMDQFKADHPEIDWEKREVYAVINTETGVVERVASIPKELFDKIYGAPREH